MMGAGDGLWIGAIWGGGGSWANAKGLIRIARSTVVRRIKILLYWVQKPNTVQFAARHCTVIP